ncbi:Innexin, partial [Teladorsagia circumcincta]
YVGSPIQCWMPMEFKGGWEQYAEDYCFIQNTFFVPFHEEIPADDEDRSKTFRDLWNGREWLDSGVFPRVTMCDFKIRRLANTHKYTLVLTSFREKSTKTWLSGPSRTGEDTTDGFRHQHIMRRFTHTALRPDGILLLRFIEGHAGAIVARELTSKLFTDYLEQ